MLRHFDLEALIWDGNFDPLSKLILLALNAYGEAIDLDLILNTTEIPWYIGPDLVERLVKRGVVDCQDEKYSINHEGIKSAQGGAS